MKLGGKKIICNGPSQDGNPAGLNCGQIHDDCLSSLVRLLARQAARETFPKKSKSGETDVEQ